MITQAGRGALGSRAAPVSRPALAARLGLALDAGSVLLTAAAGYGKTTALDEVRTGRGWAAARVACSPSDREPGHLLDHLLAELRRAAPGTADALTERLAAAVEPVDVHATARELISELERLLVDPLLVIVDDAEQLAGASGALRFVGELIAARGRGLHVAVASRRALRLRTARLRAAGRLTELDAGDLAFGADECARVLAEGWGREPSTAEVEEVMGTTEGWPLGVAVAARRPTARGASGAAAREDVFAFLSEEVVDALEPEARRALEDLSVVPRIDARLADAAGLPPGLLDEVEAAAVLLRPLDGEGDWFELHPLLRELLRARFDAERDEDEARSVHERMAHALAESGEGAEAVRHWLAAGRWREAAAAILQYGPGLMRTSPELVRGWLAQLPEAERTAPALRMLEGQLELGRGSHERAIALLGHAVEGFRAEGSSAMEWLARFALAEALFLRGDFARAIELSEGFDRDSGREALAAPAAGVAAAASLARLGRFAEAEAVCRRAVEHPMGAPFRPIEPVFTGFYVDLPAGRLDVAQERVRSGIAQLEQSDPFNRLPYVWGFLGFVHEERGEDEAAVAAAERAEEITRETLLGGYIAAIAALFKAGVHARAGRLADAETELDRAGPPQPGWFAYDEAVTRATIALRRGDPAAALEHAERAVSREDLRSEFERARAVSLLVPLLMEAGAPERARELLDEALAARHEGTSGARLLALSAFVEHASGEAGATGRLRAAWDEAGEGVRHLLRREWPRLEAPLHDALEDGAIEPAEGLRAVEDAGLGGAALIPLARHALPEVRAAAIGPAAASGHPEAAVALAELARDPDVAVRRAALAATARVRAAPPPLVLEVLGGFRARRGSWVAQERAWGRPMAERIVRFLVVHRGGAVPEDALFQAFWADKPAAAARRNLSVTIHRARAVLDPPGALESVLVVSDGTYRLALRDTDVVDADEFEAAAGLALRDPQAPDRAALERAAALWTGEPLPEDRYAIWALSWRERLLDRYLEVLAGLVFVRSAAGDHAGAVEAGRMSLDVDPLNEAAHRGLMAAYARAGRPGHALRQYLECRRILVDELGTEPGAETAALHARILAGEPA